MFLAFSHRRCNSDPLDCFCTAGKYNFSKGKQNCCPRGWLLLGVWTSTESLQTSNSSVTKLILQSICSDRAANALLHLQVLFRNPGVIMGHIVRSWGSTISGMRSTELLRCVQQMPDASPANTCYTAGQ